MEDGHRSCSRQAMGVEADGSCKKWTEVERSGENWREAVRNENIGLHISQRKYQRWCFITSKFYKLYLLLAVEHGRLDERVTPTVVVVAVAHQVDQVAQCVPAVLIVHIKRPQTEALSAHGCAPVALCVCVSR